MELYYEHIWLPNEKIYMVDGKTCLVVDYHFLFLQEYSEEYHSQKEELTKQTASELGGKALFRSHSIQDELSTAS